MCVFYIRKLQASLDAYRMKTYKSTNTNTSDLWMPKGYMAVARFPSYAAAEVLLSDAEQLKALDPELFATVEVAEAAGQLHLVVEQGN